MNSIDPNLEVEIMKIVQRNVNATQNDMSTPRIVRISTGIEEPEAQHDVGELQKKLEVERMSRKNERNKLMLQIEKEKQRFEKDRAQWETEKKTLMQHIGQLESELQKTQTRKEEERKVREQEVQQEFAELEKEIHTLKEGMSARSSLRSVDENGSKVNGDKGTTEFLKQK